MLKHISRKQITAGLLFIILAFSAFLRFYQINKLSFWLDESYAYHYALDFQNFLMALKNDPNMCLFYVIAHLWIKILPFASDGLLRSLSALFSLLSILVVFFLGKELARNANEGLAIGLITALLVGINSFHIEYAQEFRTYSLTFFLTSLSTLSLMKVIKTEGRKHLWAVIYVLVTAASVYAHLLSLFLIAAQVITLPIVLLDKNTAKQKLKLLLSCGIAIGLLIMPCLILAYYSGSGLIDWIARTTPKAVSDYLNKLSGFKGKTAPYFYYFMSLLGFLLGMGIINKKTERIQQWKTMLMISCLAMPIVATLLVSEFVTPLFIDRYLLFVLPYLAVFAAVGIVYLVSTIQLSKQFRSLAIPIGIILLLLFVKFSVKDIQDVYKNKKEDWRGASQMLTDECSGSLRLYYPPFISTSATRYNPDLSSQEAAVLNPLFYNSDDMLELSAALPEQYDQVCLVTSHVFGERVEQAKLIKSAIQSKYPEVTEMKFYGVDIEIFR